MPTVCYPENIQPSKTLKEVIWLNGNLSNRVAIRRCSWCCAGRGALLAEQCPGKHSSWGAFWAKPQGIHAWDEPSKQSRGSHKQKGSEDMGKSSVLRERAGRLERCEQVGDEVWWDVRAERQAGAVFTQSSTELIFIDHMLYVQFCSRHWGYNIKQHTQIPCPCGT